MIVEAIRLAGGRLRANLLRLAAGSFFSDFAEERGLEHAVVGASLASDLGLDPATALRYE